MLAWHGAGRTVAANAVAKACEELRLKDKLEAFKQGAEAGAVSLLVSFFFRQAEQIGGEPSFEFTHKSFGEYLAARRLVRHIATTHEQRERNRRDPEDGWPATEALKRWTRMTGSNAMDESIVAFLRRQIGLQERNLVRLWQQTLADMFGNQLQRGLPMHQLGLRSFREMTLQARNAEESLLVAISSCSITIQCKPRFDWVNAESFRDLIFRMQIGTGFERAAYLWALPYLDLSRQSAHWARISFAELSNSKMAEINMNHGNLYRAILIKSDTDGASLRGVFAPYSIWYKATLKMATLAGADLMDADLTKANLTKADLSEAELVRADLTKTNLTGANLTEANLTGANLRGANLTGAELEGVNLTAVRRLDGARGLEKVKSWRGAKIERKWVERLGLDADKLGLVVVDDLDEEKPAHSSVPQE